MSVDEISTDCFEKPSLYLLSLLLGPQHDISGMVIPSDFGPLTFKGMDLLQQRGQIPRLELCFELAGGFFRAVYFGHVSPFKLGDVRLEREGLPEINHVFSEAGKVHIPMQAASQVADLPSGLDWKILAGSLCLWRACSGLPNGCDSSLGKYFNKMKSVSRYQWSNVSYEIQGNDIFEEWSSCIYDAQNGEIKISFFIKNGLLASLKY
ncbi:hypothetical protein [Desulfovibrio sp. JC022]|uniref:hypothetical protein n=1 Tax=Desulfovibrio sp. JC022 TaxID=2593642 RepID=UPI0013D6CFD3|nr:hypothetical protein [Desulfovibrio sp. JC022]NDV22683.1 hypothetical protein [Desulfovibrio sp. JC022]